MPRATMCTLQKHIQTHVRWWDVGGGEGEGLALCGLRMVMYLELSAERESLRVSKTANAIWELSILCLVVQRKGVKVCSLSKS